KAEQFAWSSYRSYISNVKPHWLYTNFTLNNFGKAMQKKKYKSFVEEGIDDEFKNIHQKLKGNPILGTKTFISSVRKKYLKEKHKIDDIPEHKKVIVDNTIDFESIIYCVARYYSIEMGAIRNIKKRSGNQPRAIVIYIANTIGQYTFSQISN